MCNHIALLANKTHAFLERLKGLTWSANKFWYTALSVVYQTIDILLYRYLD